MQNIKNPLSTTIFLQKKYSHLHFIKKSVQKTCMRQIICICLMLTFLGTFFFSLFLLHTYWILLSPTLTFCCMGFFWGYCLRTDYQETLTEHSEKVTGLDSTILQIIEINNYLHTHKINKSHFISRALAQIEASENKPKEKAFLQNTIFSLLIGIVVGTYISSTSGFLSGYVRSCKDIAIITFFLVLIIGILYLAHIFITGLKTQKKKNEEAKYVLVYIQKLMLED